MEGEKDLVRAGSDNFMVEGIKGYNIGLLRGGPSSEREISLLSGEQVLNALLNKELNVKDLILPQIRDLDSLKEWVIKKLRQEKIEVCFIALHGWFGEDGCLQQILEAEGYLYTGSGPEASRLAMDKIASRILFQKNNISVPKYLIVDKNYNFNELKKFGLPFVVKPSAQGSSVGVSKVEKEEQIETALNEAIAYDGKALVEEFITGYELTVGILEDEPLPVIRIKSSLGLYNFKAKYTQGLTEYIVPADIAPQISKRAQELALSAHRILGCNSFSRVDMLYSTSYEEVYVLEVNTIPGLTKTSLLPKAAKAIGIEFDDLILKMLESAFSRVRCLK